MTAFALAGCRLGAIFKARTADLGQGHRDLLYIEDAADDVGRRRCRVAFTRRVALAGNLDLLARVAVETGAVR